MGHGAQAGVEGGVAVIVWSGSSEQRAAIGDGSPDVVITFTVDGSITWLNPAAEQRLGPQDGSMRLSSLIPADALARLTADGLPQALRDGTWSGEVALRDREGTVFPVSTVLVAHRDERGEVTHLSAVLRDTSEARERALLHEALLSIHSMVATCPDFGDQLRLLAKESAQALQCGVVGVGLREREGWYFEHLQLSSGELRGLHLPDEDAPFAVLAANARDIIVVDDVRWDPRANAELTERFHERALMAAPIVLQDEVLAVLILVRTSVQRFTRVQVDFVRRLAATVALALGNARMVRSLRDELQRRHELEAELARQRDFLEKLFVTLPSVVLVVAPPDWRCVMANHACEDLVGAAYLPLVGKTLQDVFERPEETGLPSLYRLVVQEREAFRLRDYPLRFPGAEEPVYLDGELVPIQDADGAVQGILVVAQDVSRHVQATRRIVELVSRAEQRAAEAEEGKRILEALMEYVPEGITIIDGPDESISMVSRYGCELVGLSMHEVRAMPMTTWAGTGRVRVAGDAEAPDVTRLPAVRSLRAGEVVVDEELILRHADGREIPIQCTSGPIRGAEGQITGAIVVWRDITAKRQVERTLADHAKKLEAALSELESFSYSVSHDLRAPLRALDGFSALLMECAGDRLDDDAQRYLQLIRRNAVHMGHLVDDLLSFARMGRQQMRQETFEMESLVQDIWRGITDEWPQRRMELKVHPLPPAYGDHAMLRRAFANLLENAAKYTLKREVAHVEVGCRQEEEHDVYWVQDNGVGFDMRYAHKLFKVFSRLHTDREFEGTGVGLAVVAQVVARHGGRVWTEAQEDQGATFYVSLPRVAPSASQEGAKSLLRKYDFGK